MAQLVPILQKYFDFGRGLSVGVHLARSTNTTSDTIHVPQLAGTTANESSALLQRPGAAAHTVTDDADDDITITYAASTPVGTEFIVVTLHRQGAVNYGPEA